MNMKQSTHIKIRLHDEFVANLSSDQSKKSMHLGKCHGHPFLCLHLSGISLSVLLNEVS